MTKHLYSDKNVKLRELLIQARKDKELTQLELAEKLNRPQSFVSKYEIGERRLDVIEFLEICEALGIHYYEIIKALFK